MRPLFMVGIALAGAVLHGCSEAPLAPTRDGSRPAAAVVTRDEPLPFYAHVEFHQFEGNLAPAWSGIFFVRPPECVPASFNLLQFFDVPGAFSCVPMTVETLTIRKDPLLPPPFQFTARGLGAVPVWLASAADMESASADGVLTLTEVESLPSLVTGYARIYRELVQPEPREPAQVTIVASGTLADGRSFHVKGGGKHMLIEVR